MLWPSGNLVLLLRAVVEHDGLHAAVAVAAPVAASTAGPLYQHGRGRSLPVAAAPDEGPSGSVHLQCQGFGGRIHTLVMALGLGDYCILLNHTR